MGGQAQQQQQSTAVSTGGPAETPVAGDRQSRMGNSFLQEQLKSRGPGKLSWQGALGESIGGRLYDALSAQLTDDKLLGHANKVVDGAIAKLRAGMQGGVQPSEQEAANLLLAEIDKALKQVAQQAVVASGLTDGIRDFTDVHPYEIALAAAAGAVAYVLSNQDLPLFETKLGLGGGHSLVGGVDPGRTLSLALEQVRVGYRYQGDRIAAHLTLDRFDNGTSAAAGVRFSPTPEESLALNGSRTDRDGARTSKLDLSYMNSEYAANLGWQRNTSNGRSNETIGASLSSRGGPGELDRHISGKHGSDGSWEAAAGFGRKNNDSSWSVEAYGGRDAGGNESVGIRALYKLRF